jgi:aspartyl-tRNA(Asn)/glutamyl-tRNA(Gln) amidotransferase subunit B
VELGGLLKINSQTYNSISVGTIEKIVELLQLLKADEINSKQAKVILEKVYSTDATVADTIKQFGFIQIKDRSIIESHFKKYILENEEMLKQYHQRPERVEKFFVGLLMRDTKGQANPNIAMEILKKLLNQ